MKKVLKRHWWIILLFLLIAILFPLVLNWVMQKPAIFKYVGDSADWLGFWAAYISAIASFAMVIITWMTLSQNKAQLNEMKRQWEEEHRPRLEIYFCQNTISKQLWNRNCEHRQKSSNRYRILFKQRAVRPHSQCECKRSTAKNRQHATLNITE